MLKLLFWGVVIWIVLTFVLGLFGGCQQALESTYWWMKPVP